MKYQDLIPPILTRSLKKLDARAEAPSSDVLTYAEARQVRYATPRLIEMARRIFKPDIELLNNLSELFAAIQVASQ